MFTCTHQGIAEKMAVNSRFLKRKQQEYEALKHEIAALTAEVGDLEADGHQRVQQV